MDRCHIAEVSDGAYFVNEFFERAFDDPVPDFGHHLVHFYRVDAQHYVPLGYLHFHHHGEVMLVGGGVTHKEGFTQVPEDDRQRIRADGGVFYRLLRFGFERFAEDCEAYFGYVGDPRAYEVDLKAGFAPTGHDKLVANFHRPISEERKAELIAKIHALGAF